MSPPSFDDQGRVLICSIHHPKKLRDSASVMQKLHPDLFYEDEERNVLATGTGHVVFQAVQVAKDPLGRFSKKHPVPQALVTLQKSYKAEWVTTAIANAIGTAFTKSALVALTDSMDADKAAHYVASEAINVICRSWTKIPEPRKPET